MNILQRLFDRFHATSPAVPVVPFGQRPAPRTPWGKGTGRASYEVVQRRRRANRVARASRRINRRRR